MVRPDAQTAKRLSAAVDQYPVILEWLEQQWMKELTELPLKVDRVAVHQGRCLALQDVIDVLRNVAPAIAAKQ